jgi:hypothetical protein
MSALFDDKTERVDPVATPVTAPVDGPGRLRGFGVLNSLRFAQSRFGQEALAEVLRHLTPEDQRTVVALRKTHWYPFALHCRVLRAVDVALGAGDHELLYELGRSSAQRDFPTLFRPLMRLGQPGWIFEYSTKLWRFYHGEGRWEIERTPRELIARLLDFEEADAAFCVSFVGYVTAALELCGATEVEGSHPACKATGAMTCVYTVRWSVDR